MIGVAAASRAVIPRRRVRGGGGDAREAGLEVPLARIARIPGWARACLRVQAREGPRGG